ncbi:hypothetical protein ACLESD_33495 [Pyxidicoccus sp. 3LFB2]
MPGTVPQSSVKAWPVDGSSGSAMKGVGAGGGWREQSRKVPQAGWGSGSAGQRGLHVGAAGQHPRPVHGVGHGHQGGIQPVHHRVDAPQ